MAIDTHPFRLAMLAYQREYKLAAEKGFDTYPHGLLKNPGRRLLKRIGDNMVARKVLDAQYADGTLNYHMQHALIPPLVFGDLVVHHALSQVGVHEIPWGSNSGPQVRVYQSVTGGYNAPWCASFVSWALVQAGYHGTVSAWAWDWATIGTPVPLIAAKPGDIVPFNIGSGHVGIYLSQSNGMVKTVDGNTSDQVAVRERPTSIIRAITRHSK